jgi:TldD protein
MADWTRRRFLDTTAKTVALASIPAIFQLDPAKAFASPLSGGGKASDYMKHFLVDEDLIRKTMATALEHGGDYCDIYFEHSMTNQIGLEDDLVSNAFSNVDFGVGIRVCAGDQTGFSFTEEITPKAMKLAAKTAANIANSSKTMPPHSFQNKRIPSYSPIKTLWEDVSIEQKIPILQKINSRMSGQDEKIVKTQVWFTDHNKYIMLATSDGRLVCDYQPMTRLFAMCTAVKGERREQGSHSFGGREGIEYYSDEVMNHLADTAVERTLRQFEAEKPDAGEMEVVLAPGNSGILLHEAIGHGMEADFNRKGTSIFADKIGKPVAESFVSIVDDGTNPNMRGTINVDDEGNDTEKTFMVRGGTLESYLHDRISSRHYNVQPTGNGRRQSFRHIPMPRMRNTYMLPGPHDPQEIIRSVKKGVYAESFSNGQVAIGAGDFTFYVLTGYEIENGKLGRPIKDVNLIGNGPDVLSKIVMVGNDLELMAGGGTCGKNGQWMPVSFGLPTIKVSAITVGGVNRRGSGA